MEGTLMEAETTILQTNVRTIDVWSLDIYDIYHQPIAQVVSISEENIPPQVLRRALGGGETTASHSGIKAHLSTISVYFPMKGTRDCTGRRGHAWKIWGPHSGSISLEVDPGSFLASGCLMFRRCFLTLPLPALLLSTSFGSRVPRAHPLQVLTESYAGREMLFTSTTPIAGPTGKVWKMFGKLRF